MSPGAAPPHAGSSSASSLTVTPLAGIPTVRAGDDLASMIVAALGSTGIEPRDGDVLVLAQKIVSKAEGRAFRLAGIEPSPRAVEIAQKADKDPRVMELLLRESVEIMRCRPGVVIVEDKRGLVMANAGIDASNVEGADGETVLLLPEDPDASAAALRARLRGMTGVDFGIVINDSFGRAWRQGTVGTAIGAAGVPTLLDLRGQPDRNGRPLQTTELGVADEIAAAASLMMGQAGEGRPVVHMRGLPYGRIEGCARDLVRPRNMDMFR